jgi:hypothetical protein
MWKFQTPLRAFLRTETGGALVLLSAAIAALVWVNVDPSSYDALWGTTLSIDVGGAGVVLDLRHWVNSGLMTFFFFVLGLEARREFDLGELRERRRSALPLLAGIVFAYMVIPGGPAGPFVVFAFLVFVCGPLLFWRDMGRNPSEERNRDDDKVAFDTGSTGDTRNLTADRNVDRDGSIHSSREISPRANNLLRIVQAFPEVADKFFEEAKAKASEAAPKNIRRKRRRRR